MTADSDVQIVVKTRTPQGRDSLLRIAADGAISAAMDQNLLMLNGMSPQRFIAGLAVDLGALAGFGSTSSCTSKGLS